MLTDYFASQSKPAFTAIFSMIVSTLHISNNIEFNQWFQWFAWGAALIASAISIINGVSKYRHFHKNKFKKK